MDVSFLMPSTVPFNTTNSTLGSMRYTKHQRELVIRKMEAQGKFALQMFIVTIQKSNGFVNCNITNRA